MITYKSGIGQSFFDVVVMQYGDLDGGIAQMLTDNPALLNSNATFNQFAVEHKIDKNAVVNARIAAKLAITPPASRVVIEPEVATSEYIIDDAGDYIIDDAGDYVTEI